MNFEILDLGVIDYETAWKLQDLYAAQIAEGTRPPTLLLLEHPHVYTFGRKGNADNLLWNESQLKERGISTYWVDRGGDVTYHGPGQLVGYPLIPLGRLNQDNRLPETDYVGYIRKLEEMLIRVLGQFGVTGMQRPGKSGVWIQQHPPAKIAAIGVKVDVKGITRHGFALNVNPNMEYWNGIIPCGLTEPVISLADLLDPVPSMDEVKANLGEIFRQVIVSV
jgi:lipoate-protein ligase B